MITTAVAAAAAADVAAVRDRRRGRIQVLANRRDLWTGGKTVLVTVGDAARARRCRCYVAAGNGRRCTRRRVGRSATFGMRDGCPVHGHRSSSLPDNGVTGFRVYGTIRRQGRNLGGTSDCAAAVSRWSGGGRRRRRTVTARS